MDYLEDLRDPSSGVPSGVGLFKMDLTARSRLPLTLGDPTLEGFDTDGDPKSNF